MAIQNSFPTGSFTGLPLLDTTKIVAGMVFTDATGAPRQGIFPPATAQFNLVSGTSRLAYRVERFLAVTSRVDGGAELVTNDGPVEIATTAAPAANARYDVIFVRARRSAEGDDSDLPEIAVRQGATAPVGSLVKPTLPAGALELASVVVGAGATSTTQTSVTITNTARFTTWNGGIVNVRQESELTSTPALSAVWGARAMSLDTRRVWVFYDRWYPESGVMPTAKMVWKGVNTQTGNGGVSGGTATLLDSDPSIIFDREKFAVRTTRPGRYVFHLMGHAQNHGSGLRQWNLYKGGTGASAENDTAKNTVSPYPIGNGAAQMTLETEMNGTDHTVSWGFFQDSGTPLFIGFVWMQVRYLGPPRGV